MLRKLIMTDDEMDGVDSNLIRGCVGTNIPRVSHKKLITRVIRNDNKAADFSHWEDGDHVLLEGTDNGEYDSSFQARTLVSES